MGSELAAAMGFAVAGPGMIAPGLWLLGAAILIALTRGRVRSAIVLLAPLVTMWSIWQVPDGVITTAQFLGYTIEPVEGSAVRRLFATTFTAMIWTGGLFAFRQAKRHELAAAFAYASGAVGVSFAGDLITLFVCWEVMAIFSTFVVWCGGPMAARAGVRYAILHLLGGVILKAGIEGVAVHTGSIDLVAMRAVDVDTWLMLIGVLLNAAAPPFSAWLADAYPRSSATGGVFLSAFTTKTAVLALILLFPGEPVLIPIGLWMVFYGIVWALLENDARRILAYSIVNQVGFMVVAIGIGTELAIDGACAHAVSHIFYKGLLFMSAGVVLYRTGMTRCTDLGGLFRTMPLTTVCAIVGALSISSFPLTSGFTTKSLISAAADAEGLTLVYMLLAAASAGVFLHAGIKFPWFVFFQKDSGLRPREAPWNMAAAMLVAVAVCIGLGVAPSLLYGLLPYPAAVADYAPYKPEKVLYYLQLLLFAGLAFFVLLPFMQRTRTITLDTDLIWRRWLPAAWRSGGRLLGGLGALGQKLTGAGAPIVVRYTRAVLGEYGTFGRTWPISVTALWIAVLLSGYVLLYFV